MDTVARILAYALLVAASLTVWAVVGALWLVVWQ
jgi:hypothetical protein